MWDAHVNMWTDEAVAAGKVRRITSFEDLESLIEEGSIESAMINPPGMAMTFVGGLRPTERDHQLPGYRPAGNSDELIWRPYCKLQCSGWPSGQPLFVRNAEAYNRVTLAALLMTADRKVFRRTYAANPSADRKHHNVTLSRYRPAPAARGSAD
jgi:hypothetical protein